MADPTLSEDLETVREALDIAEDAGCSANPRESIKALDRVEAALKDREHLEEAARLLRVMHGGYNEQEAPELEAALDAWHDSETERVRKQESNNGK